MRLKMISFILVLSLALFGCSTMNNTNQSNPVGTQEYAAIQPYESSDSRIKHASLMSDMQSRFFIEDGLMELSKTHFPCSSVAYKTQTFLDYDELDATDGSRGLLGTSRDDNPNGLNPSSDEGFDTGNGTVTGAIILVDLYELDWYSDDDLQGISIGMVVNDALEDKDGNTVEITQERLKNYLEVTSSHLVSYMRERFNEITSQVPIYIACFSLDHEGDTLGTYMYQGYFEGTQGDFSNLNMRWMDVPSTVFSKQASEFSEQFTEYQKAIDPVLADYSYVVANARMEDDEVTEFQITITCHGKTLSEISAVTQKANDELSVFTEDSCQYKVQIVTDTGTYAIISRDPNQTATQVVTL